MIALVGDIHGEFHVLQQYINAAPPGTAFVQLGDFGYWPSGGARKYSMVEMNYLATNINRPFYFIDGNHDDCRALLEHTEPQEVWPGAIYVPRGSVFTLDGRKVLFLGGAASVDKAWNPGWQPEEDVTEEDVERAIKNAEGGVDLMLTHTPPKYFNAAHFPITKNFLEMWNLPHGWVDHSAARVQKVWEAVGKPKLYCGHMHRGLQDPKVRILNIDEVVTV